MTAVLLDHLFTWRQESPGHFAQMGLLRNRGRDGRMYIAAGVWTPKLGWFDPSTHRPYTPQPTHWTPLIEGAF